MVRANHQHAAHSPQPMPEEQVNIKCVSKQLASTASERRPCCSIRTGTTMERLSAGLTRTRQKEECVVPSDEHRVFRLSPADLEYLMGKYVRKAETHLRRDFQYVKLPDG